MLVLSGNDVGPLQADFLIPPRLKGIVIDNVKFADPQFLLFLLHKLPPDSFLSVCDLGIKGRWDDFFNVDLLRESRVRSLKWDGSPVGSSFVRMLGKFGDLKALSVSSCFVEEEERLVQEFGSFVRNSPTLERLTCRGRHDRAFGSLLHLMLEELRNSEHLRELDVSGHGDAGCLDMFVSLTESLREHLRWLVVDGSLGQADAIGFCEWVITERLGEKVSFPDSDLWPMVVSEHLTKEDYDRLFMGFAGNSGDSRFVVQQFEDVEWPFWETRDALDIRALSREIAEVPSSVENIDIDRTDDQPR
jgi:hypothetical protein